jgi:hypothetical protein
MSAQPRLTQPPPTQPPLHQSPLIFVYNADSGVLNALKDQWIKTVTPEKYDCQLCAVTYGFTGMRREWKGFVRSLGRDVKFLHRDELAEQHSLSGVELPAAWAQEGSELKLWISAEEMRSCRTLNELMALVKEKTGAAG